MTLENSPNPFAPRLSGNFAEADGAQVRPEAVAMADGPYRAMLQEVIAEEAARAAQRQQSKTEEKPAPKSDVQSKPVTPEPKAPPAVPSLTLTGRELEDHSRTSDPCKKSMTMLFAPGAEPQAMDRVKDKDPRLYSRIKDKVKDPRYIGQTGDITEATHDKKGRVNGCTFIQNVPYWLSGDAAKSYLKVNSDLAAQHKSISVDHLNGAGRTLGQEEAIAWRNSGVHAKPGKSNHGFGRAIDIQDNAVAPQPYDDKAVREALHANGFRQGDSHGPLKNDLHHWSYAGPGRATEGHIEKRKQHSHHSRKRHE